MLRPRAGLRTRTLLFDGKADQYTMQPEQTKNP